MNEGGRVSCAELGVETCSRWRDVTPKPVGTEHGVSTLRETRASSSAGRSERGAQLKTRELGLSSRVILEGEARGARV